METYTMELVLRDPFGEPVVSMTWVEGAATGMGRMIKELRRTVGPQTDDRLVVPFPILNSALPYRMELSVLG